MIRQWLHAGVAVAALAAAADAEALRCQHRLITEGDRSVEVRRYCGEPVAVNSRYVTRPYVSRRGRYLHFPGFVSEVLVEEWTYNFGPHRLMRVVRIEDGVVTDIEALGYGFLEKGRHDGGRARK